MPMPSSPDTAVLSRSCYCTRNKGFLKSSRISLENKNDLEFIIYLNKDSLTEYNKVKSLHRVRRTSNSSIYGIPETRKPPTCQLLGTSCAVLESENSRRKNILCNTEPHKCYSYKWGGKEIKYGRDLNVFYVFNNPLHDVDWRKALPGRRVAQNTPSSCSVLCQIENSKKWKTVSKKVADILNKETKNETTLSRCCKTSNPCKARQSAGVQDPEKVMTRLINILTEPMECKCVLNKIKKKKRSLCHCAEAETQSRKYDGRQQRAGRESFYRETGTSGECYNHNCANKMNDGNFFTKHIPGFKDTNDYDERQFAPKCPNPSTRCQANGISDDFASFKDFFHRLIETNECKRLAYNLKQVMPRFHKPEYGAVEVETQSPRYDQRHQRAGRESFYRDIGISGFPMNKNNIFNPEAHYNPKKEQNFGNCEDLYYIDDRPATTDRRIGSNGGCNMKCLYNVPEQVQNYGQSSVYSQLNGISNDGVLKKICHILLEPKNILSPVTPKYCTNRGTLCQVYNNEPSMVKKLIKSMTEPKQTTQGNSNQASSTGKICNVDNESALRKVFNFFHKQIKPVRTGAEATTQSRHYGGRQQRAGREVFCKNRGTSGFPKYKCQKAVEEEFIEEIVDEDPTCEESPITNKAVGIGTNCKFSLGWYKDRLAYGEPKPQNCVKDLKMAIDEWNEVPLRQTGTKIGASLNTDCGFTSYNTHAATQSRKYKGRHLRAGRETFYKEQQTSCVPKNKTIEEINNAIRQPIPLPPPDRKALRLGSDCSFCFEFYKDVPPESPENVNSKPCDVKIDPTQNKNSFYTKLIGQKLDKNPEPNKIDACTCPCSAECLDAKDVCECEKVSTKAPARRPLHIASKVSYNFNFSKSISPSKVRSLVPTDPGISSGQKETETKQDAESSSECKRAVCVGQTDNMQNQTPPGEFNSDDDDDDEADIKLMTPKECMLDLFSKKTFRRLINGNEEKPKKIITKERVPRFVEKEMAKTKKFFCPAQCKNMKEPEEKPDQPFRVASSFNFDYNMVNAMPKHEKSQENYQETFPQPEDFPGRPLKMNLFRLIIGKIRRRVNIQPVEAPLISSPCPRECTSNRKNKTWFSYILSNIKKERHVDTSLETEAKNFFSRVLSKPTTTSSQTTRRTKLAECLSYASSYMKSNLSVRGPPNAYYTKRFFHQVLARKGRHRRRRRRGKSSISYDTSYEDDDILSDNYIPPSRRKSTSLRDCVPCCVSSDCSFECDYSKRDDSTDETKSSSSTLYSKNYATT